MVRKLHVEGCFNARDLGGVPVQNRSTNFGVFFRSDSLDHLTANGWQTIQQLGVRTVIDLRDPTEIADIERPVEHVNIPYDGPRDAPFWERWSASREGLGCPEFYIDQLNTYPNLTHAVLEKLATADTPVWFHCAAGRDRTGLVSLVLFRLIGASSEAIIADYKLSEPSLLPMYQRDGLEPQQPKIEKYLLSKGKTLDDLLLETIEHVDGFVAGIDHGVRTRIQKKLTGDP